VPRRSPAVSRRLGPARRQARDIGDKTAAALLGDRRDAGSGRAFRSDLSDSVPSEMAFVLDHSSAVFAVPPEDQEAGRQAGVEIRKSGCPLARRA